MAADDHSTRRCIQCKYHVLGTAETHLCMTPRGSYNQDSSVYEGQCQQEDNHGCKDWATKCESYTPIEEAIVSETQTTIAECEAMLREMEGEKEEASPTPTTSVDGVAIHQGTYLQGQGNRAYVYCFCPQQFKEKGGYLCNILTGGRWAASGEIVQRGDDWILKPCSLEVITPEEATRLMMDYHKVKV